MKSEKIEKVGMSIDVLPTVANLFNLNAKYYIGNDAFDPEYGGLVYFPDGNWYDGKRRSGTVQRNYR